MICVNGSVLASRSGMIGHMEVADLPSASGNCGNGRLSRKRIVLSSGALSSSVASISAWPNASRTPQRLMLATQSRASTGVPSWNLSPVRRPSRHSRLSGLRTAPATICGVARNFASRPYSVSNTMKP